MRTTPATVGCDRDSQRTTVKRWEGVRGARSFDAEERLEAIEARIQRIPLHNLIVALPAP